ncbi:MAG TPA: hypothetical protein VF635_01630 [Propionibacteriaceae bacterium]|jgi:hypothetical protein
MIKEVTAYMVGLWVLFSKAEERSERGLSQSAENAILLAGAVTVATAVIISIKAYVDAHMPK